MSAQPGFFGPYGGQFVPEPVKNMLDQLDVAFHHFRNDPDFIQEYEYYLRQYAVVPIRSIFVRTSPVMPVVQKFI